MIKFYQGKYSELGDKVNSPNNICFVERDGSYVLMMGGNEYGKDGGSFKVESTSGATAATGTRTFAAGTFFAFTGDQSIYQYNGNSDWTQIIMPTLSAAELISDVTGGTKGVISWGTRTTDGYKATALDVASGVTTLETKVKDAYKQADTITPVSATNTVVVSKDYGIARTAYTLNQDRDIIKIIPTGTVAKPTVRDLAGTNAENILVTEKTLSEQTNDILANGLEIRKFTEAEAGFRASYGLFNNQTGSQLGATINIIKDQFLKGATYVAAYTADNVSFIEWPLDATGEPVAKPTGIPASITDRDQLDRFLKLTFALPATPTNGPTGSIVPDSGENTYADETDTDVYININELFDSYKGVSGVYVNKDTNDISGVVAPTGATVIINNETGDTSTGKRGVHYQAPFLTVGQSGFAISGIKQEITAYIQDLSGVTAKGVAGNSADASTYYNASDYPVFLTEIGVKNDGTLTGAASGINGEGVRFNGVSGLSIGAGSVANAISSIAQHVAGLDFTYDGDTMGQTAGSTKPADSDTHFIYAITETDGQIATSAKTIDASNLKANAFTTDLFSGTNASANDAVTSGLHLVATDKRIFIGNATGTGQVHIQDALTSLAQSTHDAISAMDLTLVGVEAGNSNNGGTGSATAPSGNAGTREAYKIINTIRQSDGKVFATDLELKPENIYFAPIAAATGKDANARVAVDGYNVLAAINSISNTIAKLDFTDAGAGAEPTSGCTSGTFYKIVHQVSQTDGQLAEEKLELKAANTFIEKIDGNLPTSAQKTKNSSDVRVAILADSTAQSDLGGAGKYGNVQAALNNISNILADYLSFHDAQDLVI